MRKETMFLIKIDFEIVDGLSKPVLTFLNEGGEEVEVVLYDCKNYFYFNYKEKYETDRFKDRLNEKYECFNPKIEVVECDVLKGYTENKQKFIKVIFDTFDGDVCKTIYTYIKSNFKCGDCYETDDNFLKVLDYLQGEMCCWYDVSTGEERDVKVVKSTIQKPPLELSTLSFDIETSSANITQHSNYDFDEIYMISLADTLGKNFVLVLGDYNDYVSIEEDYEMIECKSEKELILTFFKMVVNSKCSIITGWNIFNFDLNYIAHRCCKLELTEDLIDLGVIFHKKHYNSKEFDYKIKNKHIVDAMLIYKTLYLDNNDEAGLNYVGNKFLNRGKIDLPYKEQYVRYNNFKEDNTEENILKILEVADYCFVDTKLVLELFVLKDLSTGLVKFSNICHTSIEDIYTQQTGANNIKTSIVTPNIIYKECKKRNYIVNFCKKDKKDEKDDKKGGSIENNGKSYHRYVAPFDFKSLYGTVLVAYNLCHSTLINDTKLLEKMDESEYNTFKLGDKVVYFHKSKKGILTTIVSEMMNKREKVKALMKNEEDIEKKKLLNAEQIALKYFTNALTGFLGMKKQELSSKEIYNSITLVGRSLISKCKEFFKEKGYKDVYSHTDSVYITFEKDIKIVNNLKLKERPSGLYFKEDDFKKLCLKCKDYVKEINKTFVKPIELEFENEIYTDILVLGGNKNIRLGFEKEEFEYTSTIFKSNQNPLMMKNLIRNLVNNIFKRVRRDVLFNDFIFDFFNLIKFLNKDKFTIDEIELLAQKNNVKKESIKDYDKKSEVVKLAQKNFENGVSKTFKQTLNIIKVIPSELTGDLKVINASDYNEDIKIDVKEYLKSVKSELTNIHIALHKKFTSIYLYEICEYLTKNIKKFVDVDEIDITTIMHEILSNRSCLTVACEICDKLHPLETFSKAQEVCKKKKEEKEKEKNVKNDLKI